MSGRVRWVLVASRSDRRSRLSVGKCSMMTGYCRDMSGEVGLVSGLVRRSRIIVGTCSVMSG